MNIRESIQAAAALLEKAGVNDHDREAATLLTLAIEKERVFLFSHPEYELTNDECHRFADVIRRRSAREPFHLIKGTREFFGLDFFVEPGVLIPRPETEILVEQCIELLPESEPARFFEIGVGTGCISISILKRLTASAAHAVDISTRALALAQKNAELHGVEERLFLHKADLFDEVRGSFELIVSNPPYVPDGDESTLQPEVIKFDPPNALFGGEDGLNVVRRIVALAPEHLQKGGWLLMEIGYGQAGTVATLFNSHQWSDLKFIQDIQGIPRAVRARLA
jgi:release factor glutamine methyltransferase